MEEELFVTLETINFLQSETLVEDSIFSMYKADLMIPIKYLGILHHLQLIIAGSAMTINIWRPVTQQVEFSFIQRTVFPLHAVRDTTIRPQRLACPAH